MGWDTFDNDGSGADECPGMDSYATDDRRICADGATPSEPSRHSLSPIFLHGRSRISVVREDAVRPKKHLIIDNYTVEQLHPILDRDPVPNPDVSFEECMVTDIAICTDHCSRQKMRERPDTGARPDLVGLTQGIRMDENRRVH